MIFLVVENDGRLEVDISRHFTVVGEVGADGGVGELFSLRLLKNNFDFNCIKKAMSHRSP